MVKIVNVRNVLVKRDIASVERIANAIHANVFVNQVNNAVLLETENNATASTHKLNQQLDNHALTVAVERNNHFAIQEKKKQPIKMIN